jgi:hypothetical protein
MVEEAHADEVANTQETIEQPVVIHEPGQQDYVQTGGIIGVFVTIIGALFTVWLREKRASATQSEKDKMLNEVKEQINKMK